MDFEFVAVAARTENGVWHYHGIFLSLTGEKPWTQKNQTRIRKSASRTGFGRSTVEDIHTPDGWSRYLAKNYLNRAPEDQELRLFTMSSGASRLRKELQLVTKGQAEPRSRSSFQMPQRPPLRYIPLPDRQKAFFGHSKRDECPFR